MAESTHTATDSAPLFCARCAVQLHPGSGDYFQITIEAVADPAPPVLAPDETTSGLRVRIAQLLARLGELSEREAMDQVYRRLVMHLCNRCYRSWIENPAS